MGNGGTVGVIPYFINGGNSTYTPLIGFGCENIVSAKVLTESGVVQASGDQNPDLLWAIHGSGQFFGLVLDLTIKVHPLSIIGNPEGVRQLGIYIFLPNQAKEVCEVMADIMTDTEHVRNFLILGSVL